MTYEKENNLESRLAHGDKIAKAEANAKEEAEEAKKITNEKCKSYLYPAKSVYSKQYFCRSDKYCRGK